MVVQQPSKLHIAPRALSVEIAVVLSTQAAQIPTASLGAIIMLRVDAAYLYNLGAAMRSISDIQAVDTERSLVMLELSSAKISLSTFVYNSVFASGLRTLIAPAQNLLNVLNRIAPDFSEHVNYKELVPGWQISSLKGEYSKFEAVLVANLQTIDLYFVSAKGGFDTHSLTQGGVALFPASLVERVPEAVDDAMSAAKCLAFELPTAAAFHFHRVNEAVLRRYFDQVAGKDARPKSRNMADFINVMKTKKVGDERILDALRSLKDLHRNPLMHPDDKIENLEGAISLYAAVRSAVGYMLERIKPGDADGNQPLPFDHPASPNIDALPASLFNRSPIPTAG